MELSRRTLLLTGIAGFGALASGGLTGCSRPQDDRVTFFNWQDYIDSSLLADFETRSKLSVSYSTYASNDELADRLALAGVRRRGNRKRTSFDLIVPSDSLFRTLTQQNRLQALDSKVVTEGLLSNLGPKFRALDFDPGNRFSVPWATGTTGIGYDTTVFPEPPTWEVFTDGAHSAKMTLLNEAREAFAAALFSLGEDINTTDATVIAAAEKRLTEMKAHTGFNSETYLTGLANGSIVAAQAFSTDVAQAKRKNPNLAFVIPPEGGVRWIDVLCIPDDAPNAKGANQFVAFMLDPKVSAANATALAIDTGNEAAREFIPQEVLEDPIAFPDEATLQRVVALSPVDEGANKRYSDAWDRLTAK